MQDQNRAVATQQALEVDSFMAAAREATGLDNFGDDQFYEALDQYIASANKDVEFTELGLLAFKEDLHRTLVNRLYFEQDIALHPEILDEDISDPIIILGLPRTGTSKLQRMLCALSGVQKPYFWRLFNPGLPPASDPNTEDPRIELARQAFEIMKQMTPDMVAAHSMAAEEADEEYHMMGLAISSITLYMYTPVHSFYQWFRARDPRESYRYLSNLVRYLQWQDGGKQGRPWVLKSPFHMEHLDLLHETYPRATLVHCHREISTTIASFCRLIEGSWQFRARNYDPAQLGQIILDYWSRSMSDYLEQRNLLGSKIDVLDVCFEDIRDEPMPIVETICQKAGISTGAQAMLAVDAWEESNPAGQYGKNVYSLDMYGLTEKDVAEQFRDYSTGYARFLREAGR